MTQHESEYTAEEVEKLIVKLSKEGKKPSMIGMVLRDSYGVPDVKDLTEKTITQILEENDAGLDEPEDLRALTLKAAKLREHLEENQKDASAKRSLQQIEARIRSLGRYYVSEGKLAENWRYDPKSVNIFLD